MRTRAHRAVLALALVAGVARAEGPPASARGEIVLEPPRIAVGDVAVVELVVVTPPGVTVRPAGETAAEIPGLWVLSRETPDPEQEPQRWIHRTRLRVRARDVGTIAFPPQRFVLEHDDGARETLEVPGRAIEVVSVLPDFAQRDAPFGLRGLALGPSGTGSALVPALAGALFTLATLGLVALVRRERRRLALPDAAGDDADLLPAPDVEAADRFDAAGADTDARRAAGAISHALRRFTERRFLIPALAATTEELASTRPSFASESRWDALLAVLRALDAVHFRPADPAHAEHVAEALAAARAFVGGARNAPPSDREAPVRTSGPAG